jgi:hypothetical protein
MTALREAPGGLLTTAPALQILRREAFMPIHRPNAARPIELPAPARTLKRTEVRAPKAVHGRTSAGPHPDQPGSCSV